MPFENVYYNVTKTFEGGYVNDKDDSGGETFKGVSRVSNPTWAGWQLIDKAKDAGFKSAAAINRYFQFNKVMDELVAKIYQEKYWKPFEGQPPFLDRVMEKVFDTGVNIGVGAAAIMLQQSLHDLGSKLIVDGKIGPITRTEAQSFTDDEIIGKFCKRQEAYYRDIVRRKPNQSKFLKGWLSRAAWVPAKVN
jgi:lysozyme family protein